MAHSRSAFAQSMHFTEWFTVHTVLYIQVQQLPAYSEKNSYPLSAAMKNEQIWNLRDWNSVVIFHSNSKIQHVVCFVPTIQHTLQRTNIAT